MAGDWECWATAPLVGWENIQAPKGRWSFGIPAKEQCRTVQGLITRPEFPLDRQRLEGFPRLIAVSSYGTGYDYIDVQAASDLGILITHTPGAVVAATAELGLALILALLRQVGPFNHALRQVNTAGEQEAVFAHPSMAHDIGGQTVGLVGYGRVGQRLAELLRAVGFSVRYTRAHGTLEGHAGYATLDELLATSDFVVVATPLTPGTRHLIGCSELAQCKPGMSLINISRGPCVDEGALVKALQSGKVAGAALDVFEHEPAISSALLGMPQVLLSPHIGTTTWETRQRMTRDAVNNIVEALEGKAQNAVNAEDWVRRI